MVLPLWKIVWRFRKKKVKHRATARPSNFTPGRKENRCLQRNVHANVHSSVIQNSQELETTQTPFNRWMTGLTKRGLVTRWDMVWPDEKSEA